jgi:hypothetical protein
MRTPLLGLNLLERLLRDSFARLIVIIILGWIEHVNAPALRPTTAVQGRKGQGEG